MSKKAWAKPSVKELDVKATALGTKITDNVDATYTVGPFTFYSFS